MLHHLPHTLRQTHARLTLWATALWIAAGYLWRALLGLV